MLRRPFLILALLAVCAASPAAAQNPKTPPPTAALRAMLDHLPASFLAPRTQIGFGDPAASRAQDLRAVTGADPNPDIAQLRGFPGGDLTSYLRDPATAWRGAVGFGPGDVAQVLLAGAGPEGAMILRLTPGSGAAVAPALAAHGYAQATQGGVTAWARGQDFQLNLRARNPDDPFGGHLGRASRVWIDGDLIRQGAGWPVLQALAGAAASPATRQPEVAALLGALDGAGAGGALLGAVLLIEIGALGLNDPMPALTGVPANPPWPGLEWRSALLADFGDGATSTGVLALTVALADPGMAQTLRAHVERGWSARVGNLGRATFAQITGGPADVTIHPAGAGLWVLQLAQIGPTESFGAGLSRNRSFNHLLTGAMQRDLVFLLP